VNLRVLLAPRLLARYGDAEGWVTPQVVEGVVRLAGLSAREAAELSAGASVRPDADGAAKGDSGPFRSVREAAGGRVLRGCRETSGSCDATAA